MLDNVFVQLTLAFVAGIVATQGMKVVMNDTFGHIMANIAGCGLFIIWLGFAVSYLFGAADLYFPYLAYTMGGIIVLGTVILVLKIFGFFERIAIFLRRNKNSKSDRKPATQEIKEDFKKRIGKNN